MAPLVLEGDTLGEKHRHYNKLVDEAVSNKHDELLKLSTDDDIQNLLKIDVACKTKNVEHLLETLKSEDMLYVSRAIKKSKWLITDKQYSNIVNPEYLYTKMSPEMTAKAFNKLMLNIRITLKDEDRVEAFYKFIKKTNKDEAFKWLERCSLPFIEGEVKQLFEKIPSSLLCRIFERSFSSFELFMKQQTYKKYHVLREAVFLANIDSERYLDVLENLKENGPGVTFSRRATHNLMTKCSHRILNNFPFYCRSIHLETFVKHLKEKEDIKTFLLKHSENKKMKSFYSYDNMKHFIEHMSKESKFEFVKKIFIDKEPFKNKGEYDDDCLGESDDVQPCCYSISMKMSESTSNQNTFQWYKFAPFDVAFTDLKKLIRAESSPPVRTQMIQVLLTCAGRNIVHVKTVLKFYHEKHINEPFKFKIQFVNTFLSKTYTHEFDDETWSLLNQLFQSMEVYVESDNNVQSCIRSIIIRHVVRGESIPEVISTKFEFDSMKCYQSKLRKLEDKDAVFLYLYNNLITKHENLKITTQSEHGDAVQLCKDLLNLLNDWNKELQNYPNVIKRVKDLIKIKYDNSWNTEMDSLYNVNKSWRKAMFEESISLCPNQAVCVNALKHDPELLKRHKEEFEALLKNDALLMTGFLNKIRTYWTDSLGEELKTSYLNRLEQTGGHKALIRGLFTLLPQKQLSDIAQKFAPSEQKIDWGEIDMLVISLRKQIAKNLMKARPLPLLEMILWYAKGDYLQFAVPSLNSTLSQLCPNKIRQSLPKLLDTPVSLQKFGVRYAFYKLNSQELKPILTEIWKSTKNASIRTVLFTQAHTLLCKENNVTNINDMWELISMFIDNLSAEENQQIYKKLGDVSEVAKSIRPQFYMKSFKFLKTLPAKANCESIINSMEYKAPDIMESLDDDFVVNFLLRDMDAKFAKNHDNIYSNGRNVAAFLLSCKDEETANRRYKRFLVPLLDKNLTRWYEANEGKYHVKINIKEIINKLVYNIHEYNLKKKMHIPITTFTKTLMKLETALDKEKNFVFLTTWKLAVEFIKLLDEHKNVIAKLSVEELSESRFSDIAEKTYFELLEKMAPQFAKQCVELLTEDLNKHYLLSKSLERLFDLLGSIMSSNHQLMYFKIILECTSLKEAYMMVYPLLPRFIDSYEGDRNAEVLKEIRKKLYSHPSEELKYYYYELYDDYADVDAEK